MKVARTCATLDPDCLCNSPLPLSKFVKDEGAVDEIVVGFEALFGDEAK